MEGYLETFEKGLEQQVNSGIACSRPPVSGSVRRAAGVRGKNEEGLGREDGASSQSPLAPALSP